MERRILSTATLPQAPRVTTARGASARSWEDRHWGAAGMVDLPPVIDWPRELLTAALATVSAIGLFWGVLAGLPHLIGTTPDVTHYGAPPAAAGRHTGCTVLEYGVYGDGSLLAVTDCGWVRLGADEQGLIHHGWAYDLDVFGDGTSEVTRIADVPQP